VTPELRAHHDCFLADCAADQLYIGRHRPDHASMRVSDIACQLDAVSFAAWLRMDGHSHAAVELVGVPSDVHTFKAPAVAAHTVTAGVPQAGRPPTARGTAGPGPDSAQTRASTNTK